MGVVKNSQEKAQFLKNNIRINMYKNGGKVWKKEEYIVNTVNQDLLNGDFSFTQTSVGSSNPWGKYYDTTFAATGYVACSYPQTETNFLHIQLKKISSIPDNAVITKMTLTIQRSKAPWGPNQTDSVVRFDQSGVTKTNLALTSIIYPITPTRLTNNYGGDISLWGLSNIQNKDLPNLKFTFQANGGNNACTAITYIVLTIEFLI